MGRPKLYLTPEAKRNADRASDRKYEQSEKGRAAMRRANASPKAKERYAKYRASEKYRATQRRYRETAKAKATGARYVAAEQLRNPDQIKARRIVQTCLRRGDIVRPETCSLCGVPSRLDAHHYLGYAVEHWLSVQWLCRLCHKAAHS